MNIGICGCGTIASWISDILNELKNDRIVKYGCASAFSQECAPFAEKWGWQKTYDSYDELMNDPAVDLVYIAVPNSFHYEVCMKAIDAGKNVVCEKPFAVNFSEAQKMISHAEEKGVFISEALWPAFLPSRRMIDDLISSGEIGDITGCEIISRSNVMFLDRIKSLELGGGALLDMGPYVLGRMTNHLGLDIESVDGTFEYLESGVDSRDYYTVRYKNGITVKCESTINSPREECGEHVTIAGTNGSIHFTGLANPEEILILDKEGKTLSRLEVPPSVNGNKFPFISGYEHEFIAFEKALSEHRTECPEAPHSQTLTISRIMTELRHKAGVIFPFE